MARTVKLDSAGMLEVLRSAKVASAITAAGDGVASGITATARNGDRLPVRVASTTTDRANTSVTIAHPAGLGMEAKHGVLGRAAAAAGLDFKSRRL